MLIRKKKTLENGSTEMVTGGKAAECDVVTAGSRLRGNRHCRVQTHPPTKKQLRASKIMVEAKWKQKYQTNHKRGRQEERQKRQAKNQPDNYINK